MRLQHAVDDSHAHRRLEAELASPAIARIEVRLRAARAPLIEILAAHPVPEGFVAARAASALNPIVLIENGDALGTDLPAQPARFLGESDREAGRAGGQGIINWIAGTK